MAVISDDFVNGIAPLEFSEMDEATLLHWTGISREAQREYIRRFLGTERSLRYNPDEHLARRYNKAHDKAGKFATKAGGGVPSQTIPIRDQNGVVLGSFDYDASKPMQPQVDAALKKIGMGGAKSSIVKDSQRAVRDRTKATPPKPAKMKSARTTSTKDKTTAVKDDKAEFPKRKTGTQTVTPGKGRRLTPEEFEKLSGGTKVTAAEKKAMDYYDLPRGGGRGSGANDMNWRLRGATDRKFDKNTDEYNRDLKSAIGRHKAPVDMVVTRRVHMGGLGVDIDSHPDYQYGWGENKHVVSARRKALKERLSSGLAGHVVQDKGFVSTTLMDDIPGGEGVFGEYKMEIQVPKGTPLIHLNNAEQEIVFGSDTKIALLEVRKEGNSWILPAQIIP